MIVNLTPSCYNGCDSKRGLNERPKTLKEIRDESLKLTGTGPTVSVTGRNNRGAAKGGEPGDGGLVPGGQGENVGILSNERGAGPSGSVTGRDSRGVEGGGPGDSGLHPRGEGEDAGVLPKQSPENQPPNPYARETGTNKATKDHPQKRVLSLGVRLRFSLVA